MVDEDDDESWGHWRPAGLLQLPANANSESSTDLGSWTRDESVDLDADLEEIFGPPEPADATAPGMPAAGVSHGQ